MSPIDLLLLVNPCCRVQMKICDVDGMVVTVALACKPQDCGSISNQATWKVSDESCCLQCSEEHVEACGRLERSAEVEPVAGGRGA